MFVICMFPLLGSLAEGLQVANFVSDTHPPKATLSHISYTCFVP